jgi:hypothetical protein
LGRCNYFVLNILIAIPVFIIAHQNLIELNWAFNIDRIILFLVLIVIIQIVLRLLRTIIILYCTVCFIVYGTVIGNYGFNSVYEDYDSMIYTMSDNPNPQDIIISKLLPFPTIKNFKRH